MSAMSVSDFGCQTQSFVFPHMCDEELAALRPDGSRRHAKQILEDADVALSLHFYFLTARIPLGSGTSATSGQP